MTYNLWCIICQVEKTESIAKILKDKFNNKSIDYVIQAVPGTRDGAPKINIVGAQEFGEIKVLLDEDKQIMFSPAPMVRKMKRMLKDFSDNDYLLFTGDPAMIGVACSVVSEVNNGKYKLLKWDRQERQYYPISINIHERGNTDE